VLLSSSLLQGAANEYPNGAENEFGPKPTTPKECVEACDDTASCVAVYMSVDQNGLNCYRVDGDYSSTTGTVVSAVKADPTGST
jgi:hypothetical protein